MLHRSPRLVGRVRAPALACVWPNAARVGGGGLVRHLCSSAEPSASASSVMSSRLRSPVTWLSASATLVALYGSYEYVKTRQMTAQRAAGKPDLGGPFSLVDLNGKRVTADSLRGQWVLIYFGFTKCPDICPEELTKVSGVLNELDARRQPIQPVFITIDPARDTAARLKEYFATAMLHPRFLALTGSDDEVRAACRAYRVYFTKPTKEEIKRGDYLLDHSIISYLVDPDGEFADYYGKSLSSDEMLTRVSEFIGGWERQRWWDNMLGRTPPPKPLVGATAAQLEKKLDPARREADAAVANKG